VDRKLLGNFETDLSLSAFVPEQRKAEMVYCALRCSCGVDLFRLTGWPRIVSGRGSFFWRTVARVWREARLPTQDGQEIDSPFWLPLSTRCHGCGREQSLFDGEGVAGRLAAAERPKPRESFRCRLCRRGLVELVVGVAEAERAGPPSAVEVVSRCHGCRRQARIASSDSGRSKQEIQLDLLYGRR